MKGLKVLLVDDYVEIAALFAEALSSFGHEVVLAHDVRTAIDQLDESFNLLITDYDMPDGTGFDLVRMIPRERKIKKILISGQLFLVPDDIKSHFNICLAKPFSPQDLRNAINCLFI